mgnify:CR=1 FL=1
MKVWHLHCSHKENEKYLILESHIHFTCQSRPQLSSVNLIYVCLVHHGVHILWLVFTMLSILNKIYTHLICCTVTLIAGISWSTFLYPVLLAHRVPKCDHSSLLRNKNSTHTTLHLIFSSSTTMTLIAWMPLLHPLEI